MRYFRTRAAGALGSGCVGFAATFSIGATPTAVCEGAVFSLASPQLSNQIQLYNPPSSFFMPGTVRGGVSSFAFDRVARSKLLVFRGVVRAGEDENFQFAGIEVCEIGEV